MLYFETITDASAVSTRRNLAFTEYINEMDDVPAASNWSTNELFAARLVVRTARPVDKGNHLLPALRGHLDETVRSEGPIRELLDGPGRLGDITETELVHLCGPNLGAFWAALSRFGDVSVGQSEGEDGEEDAIRVEGGNEGDTQKRPYSSGSSSVSFSLPTRSKRLRTEIERPGFVSSASMQVGSSPSQRSSEQLSQHSSTGYVSQAHVSPSIPELATIQIVSSFMRHILQSCPPQHDTRHFRPSSLVEFSAIPSQLSGVTRMEAQVRATANGELLLYRLENGRYRLRHCLALLEAKKRFVAIKEGEPELTDKVLGQMTCEALALRLQQPERIDEKYAYPRPIFS